jgi:cytochrome c553
MSARAIRPVAGAALAALLLHAAATAAQERQPQGKAQDALRAARDAGLLVGVDVANLQSARAAGQRAVNGGTRAGAGAACASCHGPQGQGNPGSGFPRLAGLPAYYIAKQLFNYAGGSRPNEVMTPIAAQLTEAERRDIGVYFATLSAPATPLRDANAQLLRQGEAIATVGSPERGVQSCSNCHGPNGSGMPPDVPYLAGQNAQYMQAQLQRWQEGKRSNDILGVMRDVAHRLSAEEQRAVSQYFASLAPPARVQSARSRRTAVEASTATDAPATR